MFTIARYAGAAAFGFAAFAGAPSFAASQSTEAVAAAMRLHASFLASASQLAATHARGSKVKDFAKAQADTQHDALAALIAWKTRDDANDLRSIEMAADDMRTGRSVAVEPPADTTPNDEKTVDMDAAPEGVGVALPAAAVSLAHLSDAKGEAFDTLYKAVETDALAQLAGFYDAYARTGDDPKLRAIATLELPKVKASLEAIASL